MCRHASTKWLHTMSACVVAVRETQALLPAPRSCPDGMAAPALPIEASEAAVVRLGQGPAPAPAAAALKAGAEDGGQSSEERRTKLMPWDHVAAVLLEPHGRSDIGKLDLGALWSMTAAGSRKAMYHSHLCAPVDSDPWHVGAGLSTTAEALLTAISALQGPGIVAVVKPEVLAGALAEAAELEPHLVRLQFGKGSAKAAQNLNFQAYKRQRRQEAGRADAGRPQATEGELRASCEYLHEWLSQEESVLRGLLAILGSGGTFYTAQCAEKVARSAVKHKPLDERTMLAGATARSASSAHPVYGEDDEEAQVLDVSEPAEDAPPARRAGATPGIVSKARAPVPARR